MTSVFWENLNFGRLCRIRTAFSRNPELYQKCQIGAFRSIHTYSFTAGKLFRDRENAHSYDILRRTKQYKLLPETNSVWLEKDISTDFVGELCANPPRNSSDIANGLNAIVAFCNKTGVAISDERFDAFVDTFGVSCEEFSNDQIERCLHALQFLPEPPGSKSRNFFELWKPLDDTCLSRLQDYNADEIMLLSDYWYQINLAKWSEFVYAGVKKLGRKVRKLTPSQLVQFTFLCNLIRNPSVEMIDVEKHFDRVFNSLSIDEVGIMCVGFFKTQSKLLNDELIAKIYKRVTDNLDTVGDISLVNYVKALRYSSKLAQADLMMNFLQKVSTQLERTSLLACLHVALMGCDLQICDEECIEIILNRFFRNVDEARLKDLERISHVMGLFNVKTKSGVEDELCEKILVSLHSRIDEIIRYPKCFQACLHYLTLCGHHNEDLLNASLDQNFIQHIYGKNSLLGREVFCLDSFARINLKDTYNGNLLSDAQRKLMGKLFTHYIPEKFSKFKLSVTDRILVEVNEECRAILGESCIKHVLPHFERADIVAASNGARTQGSQINAIFANDYLCQVYNVNDILGDDQHNISAICIVVGGWNNFVRKTSRPTGLLAMKLMQLEILGYKPVLIPWYEWRELETTTDKHSYLQRKIRSSDNRDKY